MTETSEHQAAALLSALSSLETGSLYYDKYVVDQGQRRGVNSIIAYASLKTDPNCKVILFPLALPGCMCGPVPHRIAHLSHCEQDQGWCQPMAHLLLGPIGNKIACYTAA